jgi:PIN domain nuclease of toxin-antitoxin system
MPMPTLLDTHAWVWWVTEDRRLSARAKSRIEASLSQQDLWLSLISVWEVAKKVEKQQLVLDRTLDQWLDAALTRPGLRNLGANALHPRRERRAAATVSWGSR